MKNLRLIRKFAVMVVSVMMVMTTFAVPSFAAAGDATITGVDENNATVKAYQFIEQDENNKWIPMDWVGATDKTPGKSFTVTDPYDSTNTAVFDITSKDYNKAALAILANIVKSKATKPAAQTFTHNGTAYAGNLPEKGAYLVLVDPPAGKTTVYMPAVISRDFATDNPELEMTVNVKKATPEPDKNIITKADAANKNYGTGHEGGNANVAANDNSKKGDTLAAGDITQFEITSPVPAYSQDYFFKDGNKDVYPMFRVSDKLTHLTMKVDTTYNFEVMSVKDNGEKIRDVTYELVNTEAPLDGKKAFCIRITDKNFLKAGGTLSVRYWATLDADAVSGFGNENNNHVTVEYSTKPGQDSDFTKKDIDTYHHTFDIDGDIYGNDEGREFVKVGKIGGKLIISEKVYKKENNYLAGAVFELKKGDTVIAVAESAADGRLKAMATTSKNYGKYKTKIENGIVKNGLTKLDAGKYILTETVAPDGYALNNTKIPVSIKATVDEATGKLLSYSVEVNGDKNTYTWVAESNTFTTTYLYKGENGNTLGTDDPAEAKKSWETQFENTDVGTLPSTGGMGTILFTCIGIGIILLGLLLLFGGRRRKEQGQRYLG